MSNVEYRMLNVEVEYNIGYFVFSFFISLFLIFHSSFLCPLPFDLRLNLQFKFYKIECI